ncbi:MAG: hypothetical protein MJE77_43390 [Proteobacteria bacterium]|nr:hypothetical protein [Pseudomonadota bacterium]
MVTLNCSATVHIRQIGHAGVMHDERYVRLEDQSVARLADMAPALVLAHSGVGTFDVGGATNPRCCTEFSADGCPALCATMERCTCQIDPRCPTECCTM